MTIDAKQIAHARSLIERMNAAGAGGVFTSFPKSGDGGPAEVTIPVRDYVALIQWMHGAVSGWPAALDEVDRLNTEATANGAIMARVNDAISRAGIYCAITWPEAIDQIARERDQLRENLAAMTTSANVWRDESDKLRAKVIAREAMLEAEAAQYVRQGYSRDADRIRVALANDPDPVVVPEPGLRQALEHIERDAGAISIKSTPEARHTRRLADHVAQLARILLGRDA